MKKENFAARLKIALENKEISAAELSRLSGISEGVISQYKSGLYTPKDDRLSSFAKILGVSTAWLSGYDVPITETPTHKDYEEGSFNGQEFTMRIIQLRKNNNLEIEDTAKKLQISKNKLIQWENCDGVNNILSSEISLLAELYNTSPSYLMGWIKDPSLNAEKLVQTTTNIELKNLNVIAILDKVIKGPNKFIYKDIIGFEILKTENPYDYFFYKVKEESLEPYIGKNEVVLIQKTEEIKSADIALIITDDNENILRKVIYNNGNIFLQAFNAEIPPIIYNKNETKQISFVGKVLQSIQRKEW